MSTSQRVSRGFHRLGVFLAAIPLFLCGAFTINIAAKELRNYRELACANEYLGSPQLRGTGRAV